MKKRNRKNNYDWVNIQQEYDAGASIRKLATKYGMATRSFTLAAERGDFRTRSYSEASTLSYENGRSRSWSIEAKERHSEIMSTKMKNRKVSSKRFIHNGIVLESSWEKQVADSLDDSNIAWIRPSPIIYNDSGQNRRYYPDFYLPDYDVYLDPKNRYVKIKDERKLSLVVQQNDINLLILDENQLCWEIIKQLIPV